MLCNRGYPRTATDPQEQRPQVIDVIVDNHNPYRGGYQGFYLLGG